MTEAETIWIIDNKGGATAGHTVAYDQATGFGLIQALGRLELPELEMGSSADVCEGESAVLAGDGGREKDGKRPPVRRRDKEQNGSERTVDTTEGGGNRRASS